MCTRTHKRINLLKIRAKSLKIWAKLMKIRAKLAPNIQFDFNKWRPTFAEKHMKTYFLVVISQKGFYDLCGRKCVDKVAQKLFGQVWGYSGKILNSPKNLPALTPMN